MSDNESSSSSDDEKTVERVDTGSSAAYRFKKFMASGMTGTKAGRRFIISIMGNEGDMLLKALKSAAVKFQGKSIAKAMKKDFLKIMLKAKLCVDEKRITPQNTAHAQDPVNDFAMTVMEYLKKDPSEPIELDPFISKFNKIRDICADIMKPHMQTKNLEKLERVFNFYGDPVFVKKLLQDPDFAEERRTVKDNLGPIVNDLKNQLDMFKHQPRKCRIPGCPFLQAHPEGDFHGSEYCSRHHKVIVMKELEKPSLHLFLNPSAPKSSFFVDYLKAHGENEGHSVINLYRFYDAVVQYRKLQRNLRKGRATLIFTKYFRGQDAIQIEEKTANSVSEDLPLADQAKLRVIFDDAMKEVEAKLKVHFEEYIQSDDYKKLLAYATLPPSQEVEEEEKKE